LAIPANLIELSIHNGYYNDNANKSTRDVLDNIFKLGHLAIGHIFTNSLTFKSKRVLAGF
jgi:hypothetical protein